ncbi:MAG: 5'-nucleotidase [Bacteroidales bacterium]
MPFPIEKKLVIAIASSALFDLSESDTIFRTKGIRAYKKYQEEHIDNTLPQGVAFPFIRRLLHFNTIFTEEQPVEVILMSRNSPETGMRVFRSIQHYGLPITRAAFFSGNSPFKYLPAYNVSLFLSAHNEDVRNAIQTGYGAGRVINSTITDIEKDSQLRLAFDFDGVLADDAAEKIYQETHDLQKFHDMESHHANIPHIPGPLQDFIKKISLFQDLEKRKSEQEEYTPLLNISLITARNSPSHERVVNTLKAWGISVDQTFFLGGIDKSNVLKILKPHIYFDDQLGHLKQVNNIPLVHIPFGIVNNT